MSSADWVDADRKAVRRVWKTVDGDFVPEGDARAAFLAYGLGDEVSPIDLAALHAQVGPTATGKGSKAR